MSKLKPNGGHGIHIVWGETNTIGNIDKALGNEITASGGAGIFVADRERYTMFLEMVNALS